MKKFFFLISIFLAACHSGAEIFPDSRDPNIRVDGNANTNSNPLPSANTTPGAGAEEFKKGATLVCWSSGCYQVAQVSAELDYLQSVGVNWLAIVPTWYQDSLTSDVISENSSRSPNEADLRAIVALARQRGFKILLKPHVDVLSGGWRGNINPLNLAAWQGSYRNFILNFARLAQELNVEVFSVGTELKRRSTDLSFWLNLILGVKDLYGGKLTYSANWDEYLLVGFWHLLDTIGIDFYNPLTSNNNATEAQIEAALRPIGAQIQAFSAAQHLPVLFTEIGYRSVDGANTRPYDTRLSGAVDLQEQADCYQAVLTVFQGADWLKGIFWWREDPRFLGGTADDDYFFYGKPAATVLQRFWRGH